MISILERYFPTPWRYFLARFSHLLSSHVAYIFSGGSLPSPTNLRPLTDQQRKDKRDEFINSIDTDAIRALASKYNGGLPCTIRCQTRGSFNVCFALDFDNGTTRLVRVPIEPAVCDVWDKVCSEVYTMQYVLDHTNIPLPRVYAYGRSRLQRDTSTYQVFMILDYIEGQHLTEEMLRDSSKDRRSQLLGEVVDLFAQLRRLEFSQGGSLMPNVTLGIWARLWTFIRPQEQSFTPKSTLSLGFGPKIVGAFSMRKNELQVDGCTASRSVAPTATATDFFAEQYRLLQDMWNLPVQELDREEAEREQFALHAFSFKDAQKTLNFKAGGSFYLTHPDPRLNNIIVDDDLHIRGIIDWEFSMTVPRQAFLPPSWITGHDSTYLPNLSSELTNVLSSRKEMSSGHSQLEQDWKCRDDLTLPMAYILLDPSDLCFLFYRCIYPRLFTEPRDTIVPRFFQRPENKELEAGVVRRLHACKRYTQYLKDHNLFDDTEKLQWQEIKRWTEEAKKKLQEVREKREKSEDELMTQLEGLRALQGGEGPRPVPGIP